MIASRDPHLAAIGFVWPPLPSFLDIPILAFQRWFPFLSTQAFAGSVEAALFGAGTVVLLNLALRRARVACPSGGSWFYRLGRQPDDRAVLGHGDERGAVRLLCRRFPAGVHAVGGRTCVRAQLALLAVVVGLGTLVRIEMVILAAVRSVPG